MLSRREINTIITITITLVAYLFALALICNRAQARADTIVLYDEHAYYVVLYARRHWAWASYMKGEIIADSASDIEHNYGISFKLRAQRLVLIWEVKWWIGQGTTPHVGDIDLEYHLLIECSVLAIVEVYKWDGGRWVKIFDRTAAYAVSDFRVHGRITQENYWDEDYLFYNPGYVIEGPGRYRVVVRFRDSWLRVHYQLRVRHTFENCFTLGAAFRVLVSWTEGGGRAARLLVCSWPVSVPVNGSGAVELKMRYTNFTISRLGSFVEALEAPAVVDEVRLPGFPGGNDAWRFAGAASGDRAFVGGGDILVWLDGRVRGRRALVWARPLDRGRYALRFKVDADFNAEMSMRHGGLLVSVALFTANGDVLVPMRELFSVGAGRLRRDFRVYFEVREDGSVYVGFLFNVSRECPFVYSLRICGPMLLRREVWVFSRWEVRRGGQVSVVEEPALRVRVPEGSTVVALAIYCRPARLEALRTAPGLPVPLKLNVTGVCTVELGSDHEYVVAWCAVNGSRRRLCRCRLAEARGGVIRLPRDLGWCPLPLAHEPGIPPAGRLWRAGDVFGILIRLLGNGSVRAMELPIMIDDVSVELVEAEYDEEGVTLRLALRWRSDGRPLAEPVSSMHDAEWYVGRIRVLIGDYAGGRWLALSGPLMPDSTVVLRIGYDALREVLLDHGGGCCRLRLFRILECNGSLLIFGLRPYVDLTICPGILVVSQRGGDAVVRAFAVVEGGLVPLRGFGVRVEGAGVLWDADADGEIVIPGGLRPARMELIPSEPAGAGLMIICPWEGVLVEGAR